MFMNASRFAESANIFFCKQFLIYGIQQLYLTTQVFEYSLSIPLSSYLFPGSCLGFVSDSFLLHFKFTIFNINVFLALIAMDDAYILLWI